jgi:hypothetical protein
MAQISTSIPFASLDAATSPVAGATKDLDGSLSKHTIAVHSTGSPASFTVDFEGSHDNVTWFATGAASITSNAIVTVDNHLFRYMRANLTALTGGSSPTVTATIASAGAA